MKSYTLGRGLCAFAACVLALGVAGCKSDNEPDNGGIQPPTPEIPVSELTLTNTQRAIEIVDAAVENYFEGTGMAMSRYYNPYNGQKSSELGSVWMYTSSIEAVNSVLKSLKAQKEAGKSSLYDANFSRYSELLSKLVENLDFYAGTYTLTSYTGTNEWTVYE